MVGMAADCRSQSKRKPRRGITGVFGARRSAWEDPIAAINKQHRGAVVHIHPHDFHNFSYHAATTGSMSEGSLFLTLPTRALTGQQIMSSEG
jgi:hypothetical protein